MMWSVSVYVIIMQSLYDLFFILTNIVFFSLWIITHLHELIINNNNMYFLYSAIPTGPLLMALYNIILIKKY